MDDVTCLYPKVRSLKTLSHLLKSVGRREEGDGRNRGRQGQKREALGGHNGSNHSF